MALKTKIVVAGIGGVGGYFGGLLARKYENSDAVEICFLARGEHLNQIRANGLRVISDSAEFVARPAWATDNANEIGIADYILICSKSYDLETIIESLKPCISESTVVLPLLNGVDHVGKIRRFLPGASVIEGCVYIVSRIKEAGVIENSGKHQILSFGPGNNTDGRLVLLEKILKDAGTDAALSDHISTIVWEKFIFIAAIGTATSWFDCSIGKLMAEKEATVVEMVEEVKAIAMATGIPVDKDITVKTIAKLRLLPYATTSSMHRDYQNRKPHTEVESLTGYVVRAGRELNIETPLFNKAYLHLTGKG